MLLGAYVFGTNVNHIPHVFMKHVRMQQMYGCIMQSHAELILLCAWGVLLGADVIWTHLNLTPDVLRKTA